MQRVVNILPAALIQMSDTTTYNIIICILFITHFYLIIFLLCLFQLCSCFIGFFPLFPHVFKSFCSFVNTFILPSFCCVRRLCFPLQIPLFTCTCFSPAFINSPTLRQMIFSLFWRFLIRILSCFFYLLLNFLACTCVSPVFMSSFTLSQTTLLFFRRLLISWRPDVLLLFAALFYCMNLP